MKVGKCKADLGRGFIAAVVAVVSVVSCALCVAPNGKVCVTSKADSPFVFLVSECSRDVEHGVSAGFFLPTDENISFRATVPAPQYDIGVVDIRTLNVFREGDRAQIVANIDSLAGVATDNIVNAVHLSESMDFIDSNVSIRTDGTEVENILTGDRFFVNFPDAVDGGTSTVAHKIGNMVFSSPSGVRALSVGKEFLGRDGAQRVCILKTVDPDEEVAR
ncbi:MAG: hypothetical protein LBB18_02315 [Puniceicoccales bacterium]|jgi:hypothetical protein|nr:hypothetical protein [Puniceicoccales bacterium]